MPATRTSDRRTRAKWTTSLVALIAVVLTSIAFPTSQADEPSARRSSFTGWWHKQTRMFRDRHSAKSQPKSRPVATRRQATRPSAPRSVAVRVPVVRPTLRTAAAPGSVRTAVQAPRVPANRPPAAPLTAGYARLNAPLYPSPAQNIPHQVGGVVISNPALAPHEMLYEHEYRGLYPPYYYKVKGWWLWTPFGVESHDKWELTGTEVRVRYRNRSSLLRRITDPFIEPFID